MKYTLYGDGINDDTLAIQELLDTSCEVVLPAPKAFYLISSTLIIHSNTRLVLPRFAEIRLKAGSDCLMLKSETVYDPAERISCRLYQYVNMYSPDHHTQNISVEGGIWNLNNKEQSPNPLSVGMEATSFTGTSFFCGMIFLFYNVHNLKVSSLTFKDPSTYAMLIDKVSYFNIQDLTFDFNDGNRWQSNMDGVHVCGNCHHGNIENLFGTCYDDIVALNSEEGSRGPITDITVKGIYTDKSYSAVRLLGASPAASLKNIHISDIYGTFYHFVIGFMDYYNRGARGVFENITIDNVYASKSDRALVKFPIVFRYRRYGIIDIDGKIDVKNLRLENVHREEFIDNTPTVLVSENTTVDNFILNNITSVNRTDKGDMPLITVNGSIKNVTAGVLFEDGKSITL